MFKEPLHDRLGTWALGYIPYGGADIGEVEAIADAVGSGDDGAFHDAWMAAADRLMAEGSEALNKGRRGSARDLYLRASCFYATSYHPLYGEPLDPRLVAAQRKQVDAFDKGMALSNPAVVPSQIALEGTTLPAYFIPAANHSSEVRPLLILCNGYDATITDIYFASAVAGSRRGYHCLLFDGPGQGSALIRQGLRLRPDWENVVKAVVDFAIALPLVDPARIALSGWSLGGYLAPRAASGEHRLAACIADPGQWAMPSSFRGFVIRLGASPEEANNLGELDPSVMDRAWQFINADPVLRWSVVQRGFWVHGVDNLRDYLRSAEQFTMHGRAELIRCPTLLTAAEKDPLAKDAQFLFDQLRCSKSLIRFTSAEGAGDHCEMGNRSLLNRRVLDWLDDTLTVSSANWT